jgi:hypothetical protein
MNREPIEPNEPIDWGSRRPVWEWEEPEPNEEPRRWFLPVTLVLLVLGVGVAVAIALVSRNGGGSSAAPGPPSVPALSAAAISPVEVELRWTALGTPVEYILYRDGELLATVPAPSVRHSDASASPGTTYLYAIEAVDAFDRHSDRVTASVTTPPAPPVTEARLEGAWDVTLTYVEENYTNRESGDIEQETWEFDPRCASGACDVSVSLFYPEQEEIVLAREGGAYGGEGSAMLDRCEGARLSTTIVIDLTVAEAEFIEGVWTATGFTGTLQTDSEAALGCRAGHGLRTIEAQARA